MFTSTHWLLLVLNIGLTLGLVFYIARDFLRQRRAKATRARHP